MPRFINVPVCVRMGRREIRRHILTREYLAAWPASNSISLRRTCVCVYVHVRTFGNLHMDVHTEKGICLLVTWYCNC